MHLPDHFLDPTTLAMTSAIAGGAVIWSAVQVRRQPGQCRQLAAVSAVLFAAQMVNFPIAVGTSGHLLGGALAGILLGPAAGLIAVAMVLAVQALLFGDGGIAALGANILNMGVIGAMLGAWVYSQSLRRLQHRGGWMAQPIAAAVAAWSTVVTAAFACSCEMALAGTFALGDVVGDMLGVHAIIGASEALITLAAVEGVLRFVPHWTQQSRSTDDVLTFDQAFQSPWDWGLALALGIAVGLAPLASSAPDGLDRITAAAIVNQDAGQGHAESQLTADASPISPWLGEYQVPGISSEFVATGLAGAAGVLLVYLFAWSLRQSLVAVRTRE